MNDRNPISFLNCTVYESRYKYRTSSGGTRVAVCGNEYNKIRYTIRANLGKQILSPHARPDHARPDPNVSMWA